MPTHSVLGAENLIAQTTVNNAQLANSNGFALLDNGAFKFCADYLDANDS